MRYYVYMLRCRDDRLYTGITTDMERRFREHMAGDRGARFTRSYPPREVAAVWSCMGRSAASKLEYALKKLSRQQKLRLIGDESLSDELIGSLDRELYAREEIPESLRQAFEK